MEREPHEEFVAREQPPELDSDGWYGMQGAVIVFQMVNQHVALAVDSGKRAILASLRTAIAVCARRNFSGSTL